MPRCWYLLSDSALPLANAQVARRPACTAPASPIWSQHPAILALPPSAHLLLATLLMGLTCNRSLPGGVRSALALPVTVLCPSYSQQVISRCMLILWAPKLIQRMCFFLFKKYIFTLIGRQLLYHIVMFLPYIDMNWSQAHVSPLSWTSPPTSLPTQVVTEHQLWVPCLIHQTPTGYLFYICGSTES